MRGHRCGDQFWRHGWSGDGNEAQDRRLFVDQAVQLAIRPANEPAAAGQFASHPLDFGEVESLGDFFRNS